MVRTVAHWKRFPLYYDRERIFHLESPAGANGREMLGWEREKLAVHLKITRQAHSTLMLSINMNSEIRITPKYLTAVFPLLISRHVEY